MKNKRFLLFPAMLISLTSCISFTITKKEEFTFSEPNSQISVTKMMNFYEDNGNVLAFENALSEKNSVKFIKEFKNIFGFIHAINKINFYYCSDEEIEPFIINNNIFSNSIRLDSPDDIAKIMPGFFGEYCNYGAIYGYANYIYAKVNRSAKIDQDFVISENFDSSLYDLNLLCLKESFSDDTTNAKKLSNAFVQEYIRNNGEEKFEELLVKSGTLEGINEFNEALNNFYKAHNINDVKLSTILYKFGGHTYDYIVKTPYAKMYVEKSFEDQTYAQNPLTYKEFLHTKYADIKSFFEINVKQMKQYQDLFNFSCYNNKLDILFSTSDSKNYSYYTTNHVIHLKNIDSLMHEYIHSLTTIRENYYSSDWSNEGFARYFSYYYDYYGIALLNYDYNHCGNTKSTKYIFEYKEKIDREISVGEDFEELENIAVWFKSYKDPNSSYIAGSSFVQFLVKKFGIEETLNLIFNKADELSQKYNSLVSEWNSFIVDNYSSYSKY